MQLTALDYWKFHRGIIDVPKKKPKSYSLVYPNGNVVQGAVDKPYQYIKAIKHKYPNAVIQSNF